MVKMVRTEFNPADKIEVRSTSGDLYLLRRKDIKRVFLPTIYSYAQIMIYRSSEFYKNTAVRLIKAEGRLAVSEFWVGYDIDAPNPELDAFESAMIEKNPYYDPIIHLGGVVKGDREKPRDQRPSLG